MTLTRIPTAYLRDPLAVAVARRRAGKGCPCPSAAA